MQPVKIKIDGNYFDCQIYSGRLYLWTFDGDLKIINWNALINSLIKNDRDKIVMNFCFLDGNYLYKSSLIELFKDRDFRKLLLKKFARVEEKKFIVTEKMLSKFTMGVQNTPLNLIPTDTEIYSNKLYFINEMGLFSASANRQKSEKYLVSSRPTKLWDCNLFSIKANKYPQIALSGGDEGLFEYNISQTKPDNLKIIEKNIYQISENHSSFSNYTYLNIFNSSLVDKSYLAMFKWEKSDENVLPPLQMMNYKGKNLNRNFDHLLSTEAIFEQEIDANSLSWGIDDKINLITESKFEIIKCNYFADIDKGQKMFNKIYSNEINISGELVNTGSCYFGNIIETTNGLFILLSNGSNYVINEEITRWRTYPRSKNYENHLHVILDDCIEIYSFNQDYFIEDQIDKVFGIEFKEPKSYFDTSYFDNIWDYN
ncbi:hypothetical protein MKJ01_10175 [Chryseobacterium sp. SSA4.19]|uniref:hypothetical protein n=1 Tax=Chryseobacterium sp. SSA4.19 TaxID=2919915 RepID=UPI001F4E11DA|nr:hypothetical protein [Chryseobacterium sp. SSA4.19]MCJ8154125.1 hypothetical protein [Chryseobacterium sp. SSA4.19]